MRCWPFVHTVPFKCPKYRTTQDLGITYPNTPQRADSTSVQKGCIFLNFQKMCMQWLHRLLSIQFISVLLV